MRRVTSANQAGNAGPNTPPNHNGRKRDGDDLGSLSLAATAMTPMKRMPILANFEEWMKMATDNKINATNSWNFALIDYFHDMSLLKEGDGVNFQKASCTLDGCVKIYTSRVDSVATETGKLLSGLADSGNKKGKKGGGDDALEGEEVEGDGDEEDGEGGKKRKASKRAVRQQRGSSRSRADFHTAVFGKYPSTFVCNFATEEDGVGICGRPFVQKGICGF